MPRHFGQQIKPNNRQFGQNCKIRRARHVFFYRCGISSRCGCFRNNGDISTKKRGGSANSRHARENHCLTDSVSRWRSFKLKFSSLFNIEKKLKMIRNITVSDAGKICTIYNKYIENSSVTFEKKPVSAEDIISRIQIITENYPWLVYEEEGEVVGYTYATKWKDRTAYRHSVETAIYLDADHLKKGIGTKLKGTIIEELKNRSFHCIISGIALPNPASIALCEKFGFKKVAHFKEVGFKFNKWIDVAYWELIL